MKKMKYVVPLLLFFLAGYASLNSNIVEARTYTVGILDFPPFSVIEKSGECKGILLDSLEKILKHEGIPYTVKGFPPKRLFSNLSSGKTEIYMGIKGVPAYEGKVIFSDFPVADIDLRVYARKGTPVPQTTEQLKGKKIIVIMGYGYGGFIRFLEDPANNITIDPSRTHVIAFRKLKAKRANYVLDYRRPASKAIQEVGIKGIQYHSISKLDVYFIVSKKTPGATELMKRMEKAYKSLRAGGKLSEGD